RNNSRRCERMIIMEKYIVDLYPSKAQFILDEPISMELELSNLSSEDIVLNVDMKVNYLTKIRI
ncbi:MAG: hypothetical protein MUO60_17135, partial [Clostridiaceae bacterium]|nr:hypothetical protein [Clostridiaceae bacterium]